MGPGIRLRLGGLAILLAAGTLPAGAAAAAIQVDGTDVDRAVLFAFGDYKVPVRWVSGKGGVYIPFYSADGLRWRIADEVLNPDKKSFNPDYYLVDWLEGTGLYKWKGMYYLTGQDPIKIQVSFEGPERNAIRLYALYLDK